MFGRQPSFGKPPGSSQENYLTKQPAGQAGFGKTPPAMPSSGLTPEYYASKTGQAQSTPQPAKGTPYSAYAPNSSSSVATNTDGVNRTYNFNAYNNASSGNFGNNPASRPAPFTQGATGLGGQQFSDPSQAFAQRDAMIDRLNTSKSQYTANSGVYQGDGPPPASFGQRPQYDFNNLMGQANDMVQQGWTNPFSQRAGGQSQAGDAISPYAITLPADHPLAGRGNPSDNNYGKGFGPGVPILKGPGPLTSSPVTPGSAQPIAPQQPPTGYYPGGPGGFPVQPPPQAQSPSSPFGLPPGAKSQSPGMGLPSDALYPGMLPRPHHAPNDPMYGPYPTQPSRPGSAQPIAPQQPGSYYPGFDPRTQDPYGQPAQTPSDFIDHQRWLNGTGGGRLPARPPNLERMPYGGGMDYEQGPPVVRPGLTLRPPPQTQYSKKLGRNLTAEEQAAYEEGNRQWAARPRPSSAEARSWLTQDRKKLTTPKPPPTTGYNPGMPAKQPVSGPARPPSQDMISYPERQFEEYQEWARQNPNQANDLLRQAQSVATTRDPFAPSRPGPPPSQTQYGTPPTSSPVPPAPPPRRMPSWHVGGSGQSPREAELEAKTKASMASPEWQATLEASRPGRAQPIAPPEPGDPYAVGDLTKLPFYKSLMVGDTVRLNQHGQYNVFDSAGREALQYGNASQGNRLMFQRAGGRTGNTIWGSTPEGAAEQAADLKRLEERDRPIKEAAQKEGAAKIARLGELRKKQLEWSRAYGKSGDTKGLVKGRDGKYGTPWQDEYQDLLNWSSKAKYDPNLTPQQRGLIEGWFGSSAEASLSPSQASALAILKKMK